MRKTVEVNNFKITFEENLSGEAVLEVPAMRIDGNVYRGVKIKFPAFLLLKIKEQTKLDFFGPDDALRKITNGVRQ